MKYYYCFACRHLTRGLEPECSACGRGATLATRKFKRSGRFSDIYEIYVGERLIASQRVLHQV